jgi:hypothetical protein
MISATLFYVPLAFWPCSSLPQSWLFACMTTAGIPSITGVILACSPRYVISNATCCWTWHASVCTTSFSLVICAADTPSFLLFHRGSLTNLWLLCSLLLCVPVIVTPAYTPLATSWSRASASTAAKLSPICWRQCVGTTHLNRS